MMKTNSQNLERRRLTALGVLVLAASLNASAVDTNVFTQMSDPVGLVDLVSHEQTASEVSTVTAPWTSGNYRFTHWTVGPSPVGGVRQEDVHGKGLNPITFTIFEDTYAVAHYVLDTVDDDDDGVPDWYELHYYNSTNQTADSDTDADGFNLATEHRRNYHPRLANGIRDGGVSRRRSPLVPVAVSSVYRQYTERSEPPGFVDVTLSVSNGVQVTTASLHGGSAGFMFAYWSRDGVRQEDENGRALSRVSTVVTADTALVAHYIGADTDSDADGVADWYEWHFFGTTTNLPQGDSDADGFDLLTEYRRDFNPVMVDAIADGGVSRRRSAATPFDGSQFIPYVIDSLPGGLVAESGSVTSGTALVTASLHGESSGYMFGYWSVNGVRQADASGTALAQVRFVVVTNTTVTAHYFDRGEDLDGDNVADWYEWFRYGDTSKQPSSDTDGDGLDLLTEFRRNFNPRQVDILQDGGISRRRSRLTLMNMQLFERVRYAQVDGLLTNVFTFGPPAVEGSGYGSNTAPGLGDWDGDGDVDLFVGASGGRLTVFENVGTKHTLNISNRSGPFGGATAGIDNPYPSLGDWNGDGNADLALGGDVGFVRLARAPGDFVSSFSADYDLTIAGTTAAVPAFAEMTGDTNVDLLVLLDDGTINVYDNSGNPATPFSEPAATSNLLGRPVPGATGLGVADVNQDGFSDVLVSDYDGRIWEFRGSDGGTFLLWSKMWAGVGWGFARRLTLALADLDGDADTDAICGYAQGGLVFLRDPRLAAPMRLDAGGGANSIRLAWHPNREHRLDGYFIYRAASADGPFDRLLPVPVAASEYADTNVIAGMRYYYCVTAVSDERVPGASEPDYMESPPSAVASALVGAVRLRIPDYRGAPGEDAILRINVDNATGISGSGLQLAVRYDPAVMVPLSQVDSNALSVLKTPLSDGLAIGDNAATCDGELLISSTGGDPLTGEGLLFNVVFRVDATAGHGSTSSNSFGSVVLEDADGHGLAVDATDGAVFTAEASFLRGDVTGDGSLSQQDVTLLLRLAAGWRTPTEWEILAGDLNGDGSIDDADAHLLLSEMGGGARARAALAQRETLGSSGSYEVSMGVSEGEAGQELLAPVTIGSASGLASLGVQINYDPTILTVTGVVTSNTLSTAFEVEAVVRDGVVRVAFARRDGLLSGSGTLIYLRMLVNPGCAVGTGCDLVVARCALGGEQGLNLAWGALVSQQNGSFRAVFSNTTDSDGDGLTDYEEQMINGSHDYDPGVTDTDVTNPDSDNDGMLDGWEVDNGLDPLRADAGEDADGDGLSNGREHIAGTDPQRRDRLFKLDDAVKSGAGFVIRWDSVTGRVYSVWSTTNLLSPWLPELEGIPGNGRPRTYTNSLDTGPKYLRVGVELAE